MCQACAGRGFPQIWSRIPHIPGAGSPTQNVDFVATIKFEEIIDFLTTEKEMDLLVMLSHKRNFKTRFMEPSTASKVTRKMNIPVLILKEEYIFTPQKGGKLKYSV